MHAETLAPLHPVLPTGSDTLLDIQDLATHFFTDEGVVRAVDGVNLTMRRGKILAVLGESGCGKSITARSVLQIVDRPGRIVGGRILFHDSDEGVIDLAALDARGPAIRRVRGRRIAMIFQEPMSSLSAVHTIGSQIVETILLHQRVTQQQARDKAIELLRRVGIPNAAERFDTYPFQLSGGMRQRVMIAMALSCEPELLIADEPTTALDVTTQSTILDLMRDLQAERGMAIMFITHDLGVVAEIADDVAVMYLGKVVEQADVDTLFHDPRHPYTRALMASVPKLGQRRPGGRLASIRGMVPHPFARPQGCGFNTRCDLAIAGVCASRAPQFLPEAAGPAVSCHHEDPEFHT